MNEFMGVNSKRIIDCGAGKISFLNRIIGIAYVKKTQNTINRFGIADAQLAYQKEDSSWRFEVRSTNLYNNKFRQNNSFSSSISIDEVFVQLGIVIGLITYDF